MARSQGVLREGVPFLGAEGGGLLLMWGPQNPAESSRHQYSSQEMLGDPELQPTGVLWVSQLDPTGVLWVSQLEPTGVFWVSQLQPTGVL